MDNPRSVAVNCEDHVGIPDDLRCKRSDGKQWRCTAMSMPDKTVCEKHYIQAKKRAANSALRASMKKFKKSPMEDGHAYLEGKRDDEDMSLEDSELQDYHASGYAMKLDDRIMRNQADYSPETSPSEDMPQDPLDVDDTVQTNAALFGSSPPYGVKSSRKMLLKNVDDGTMSMSEDHSEASTDASDDMDGLMCHHCQRSDKDSVMWCLKCDRRGYCSSCISTWYSDIPLEDIQRACPACRGSCTCKICSRGDNLIKARIREIPVLDKLQYLYCLLSSVLPIVKQIHWQQCAEVELEKKLCGDEVDLERMKLNADEQMCCDCCRVPIVDYHRHCPNCSYDLCLSCCQDLRNDSVDAAGDGMTDLHNSEKHQLGDTLKEQLGSSKHKLSLSMMFPGWRTNNDGSIPCLPREHGGCGCPYLTLQRIFKMNWVAKLVKNLEEMVSGCKINDINTSLGTGTLNSRFLVCAYRKDSDDNFLYCPSAQDVKADGIDYFRKHWVKGEPVLVKEVSDSSSSSWDPMVIWREICENTDERVKDACRTVKAIDCLNWSEVDIELGQFLKGYSEGRTHEDGWPQMLKLKDWPSPSASEEFLVHQRPDFINKVPFLEFIHSKWGLLNVGAKLPHYSLQNDVGPKIFISYGLNEELGRGDSVSNLHFNMRDMAYLLVHSSEVKLKVWQLANTEKIQKAHGDSEEQEFSRECIGVNDKNSPGCLFDRHDGRDAYRAKLDVNSVKQIDEADCQTIDLEHEYNERGTISSDACPGAIWDIFRREDIPKLAEYIKTHWNEFGKSTTLLNSPVSCPLYDEALYLSTHHKEKLKEEFGVEPWSFHQYLGQAVFIPAGCPFQVRNLQSTVQLCFDFLSPESLGQAVKLSEEIRCLPNDHVAKLQMVEVGKISLYAASSAIKEVQKLVLDQKFGTELMFKDRNLTAMVLENLESMTKQRQVACT